MSQSVDVFAVNRARWNDLAPIHARDATGFYGVDQFRAGADSLTAIEHDEIGDVADLSILHLQCHIGLDTLSLARRGARVTGLDFSPAALDIARDLATELGIPATFVEGNVYDTRSLVPGTFDLVFATWGVFCWIPDVHRWIETAASMLAPGGRIYLADDHPTASQLEEEAGPDGAPRLVIAEHWRTRVDQPIRFDGTGSYTGDQTAIPNTTTLEWIHPLSSFVAALTAAGLNLAFLHEHDQLPWRRYSSLARNPTTGLWQFPADRLGVPLAFSLMATS